MEFSIADISDKNQLDKLQISCLEKLEHQDFYYILKNNNYVVVKGEIEGKIVCFISASISIDESDILQVCVDEKFRRKGYAKELLASYENIMKEKGVKDLFLEVNENNIPAISLYKKMNFSQISIRKKYYGENNAIVMHKAL